MKRGIFENLLDEAVRQLGEDINRDSAYHESRAFERRTLEVMKSVARKRRIQISPTYHPHAFPDIKANGFGVEVKSTRQDSWESVGNSILESMRDLDVREVYVVLGKMGGMPGVRWGRYEDVVKHVRISHAPRFVIDVGDNEKESLFKRIGVTYAEFAKQTPAEKMRRVREYARKRQKPGERIWWLDDEHTLDMRVRRFSDLGKGEQKKMRAEAAILCPQVVGSGRNLSKYDEAFHFLITYRGVLATRDMFSAGSVTDGKRGGNHVLRGLRLIEPEMMSAIENLDLALFREYWPKRVKIPSNADARLRVWLKLADKEAQGCWIPSKELFRSRAG